MEALGLVSAACNLKAKLSSETKIMRKENERKEKKKR